MRSILFAAREFHVKMRFAFEGPMWKLRSPGNSPKSGLGMECTFCAAMLSSRNTMWDSNSPHLSSARRPSSFIWSPASLFFASWRDLNGLEAWQFLNTSISVIKHPMDLKTYQAQNETTKRIQAANSNHPVCRKILQMDVFQVEERGFYVRLVCPKGAGVAASLYKALESLNSFQVQNSNLATASERFVFTFTLNVKESEQDTTLPDLKLWIAGALLNQGFEVKPPLSA